MKFLKKIRKSSTDHQQSSTKTNPSQSILSKQRPNQQDLSDNSHQGGSHQGDLYQGDVNSGNKEHQKKPNNHSNQPQSNDSNVQAHLSKSPPNNKPQTQKLQTQKLQTQPPPPTLIKSKKSKQATDQAKSPDQASDTADNKSWMGLDKQDFVAGRGYWFMMAVLCVLILAVAVKKIEQTQTRHQLFIELSTARQNYRQMHTEEQKLIIEQQTFSATPIVARRAVSELSMFYPLEKDRIVIIPPAD